jgi:predicted secreted protein
VPVAPPVREHGREQRLRRQLKDERSGRVLVVSHCLLNENVRYLGGATRPGAVEEVVHATLDAGVGLVQMPCPEQHAWGGVLKRHMLATYGRGGRWSDRRMLRRPLSAAATTWTSTRVASLARDVASQVQDYQRSGLRVAGIVGVGGSPSCGVTCTMDLDGALADVAGCPLAQMSRGGLTEIVTARARPGRGLFVAALQRGLRRRRVFVPFFEHDLFAELTGGRRLPDGLVRALTSV